MKDTDEDEVDVEYEVPPHIIEAATAIVLNHEDLADSDLFRSAAAMLTTVFESHT